MLPIPRFSVAMHNRNDENKTCVCFYCEKHDIRKDSREAAPYILLQSGVALWAFRDALNGGINAFNEANLQPGLLL